MLCQKTIIFSILFFFLKVEGITGFTAFKNNPFRPFFENSNESEKVEPTGEAFLESLNLKSPREARTFYTDPQRAFQIILATVPFVGRLASGALAEGYKFQVISKDESKYSVLKIGNDKQLLETCNISSPPTQNRGPIVMYDIESCASCRRVREAISMLSLEVEYRPSQKGSYFEKELKASIENPQMPYMNDPSSGVNLSGADEIIEYLFRLYGKETVPKSLDGSFFSNLTSSLVLLPSFGKGSKIRNSNRPEMPLKIWSAEGSPFAKIVREELCELQLPHVQISCPRGSPNRQRMFDEAGIFQIPYLEDPNTEVKLFESSAIIEYLNIVYGVKDSPVQYM